MKSPQDNKAAHDDKPVPGNRSGAGWGYVMVIVVTAAILGWGYANYFLVKDAPRRWDLGAREDVPGQSIYSTVETPQGPGEKPQIAPLPEARAVGVSPASSSLPQPQQRQDGGKMPTALTTAQSRPAAPEDGRP